MHRIPQAIVAGKRLVKGVAPQRLRSAAGSEGGRGASRFISQQKQFVPLSRMLFTSFEDLYRARQSMPTKLSPESLHIQTGFDQGIPQSAGEAGVINLYTLQTRFLVGP